MALVEGRENRPLPLTAVWRGPEVGVPGHAGFWRHFPWTSCWKHGSSHRCPLFDPSEARGQVGPRAGGRGSGGIVPGSQRHSGAGTPIPDLTGVCVCVAGSGRRPEPRGMEEPVYLGRGASRLAEPGKGRSDSCLPTPLTPHSLSPGV